MLRKLREDRKMTLRQLGEAAGQDYVLLNKIELGLRMPPPLEVIIALADALSQVKPVSDREIEQLLDLAAQPNRKAGPRFTPEVLERLKRSETAHALFRFARRDRSRREQG
jgi:transcriptional regulator with XRE-family HTH domain